MKTAQKGIRAIKKACREMAHEMMLLEYQKYDDIWWNRIRITPARPVRGVESVGIHIKTSEQN